MFQDILIILIHVLDLTLQKVLLSKLKYMDELITRSLFTTWKVSRH
jgi:hypothetical protein